MFMYTNIVSPFSLFAHLFLIIEDENLLLKNG